VSYEQPLVPRQVQHLVLESLGAFRCVVLHGTRQAGKTTLAKLIAELVGASYRTMDNEDERAAAAADPDGYVAAVGTPLVIDEVQRVGEPLVLAVKAAVDVDRRPGQFLLTGSSNFLTVPTISETLAGRVDIIELWPLAQRELATRSGSFVDSLFDGHVEGLVAATETPADRAEYFETICQAGFPEVQAMTGRSRRRWFASYLETVLDREVATAADIRHREALEAMMRLLAGTTAQELAMTNLARRLGVGRDLAERYEPWLERVFLVDRVPGWGRGLTSKLVRRPKIYAVDTVALATRHEEKVTRVVEALKDLALRRGLPIVSVVAATLEGLKVRRMRMHHFRGSSALMYEADIAVVLNEKVNAVSKVHLAYDPIRAKTFRDWAVFSIEKNRGGPNLLDVEFRKDFPHFRFDPEGDMVSDRLVDERLEPEAT
jgi:predicted AAA+ superfamily ATPase